MAPTTRAGSKPNTRENTPVKASKLVAGEETPSPSRKAPRCSKCQRPRAGHPRSGCPFVDDETNEDTTPVSNVTETLKSMVISRSDITGTTNRTETDTSDDSDIIPANRSKARRSTGRRSLTARPAPEEDFEIEDTKAVIRERRRSERAARTSLSKPDDLASLDSASAEVVKNLLIPNLGDTDDETVEGQKPGKTVHWDRSLGEEQISSNGKTTKEKKLRIPMPCSFHDPSPYSSTASLRLEDASTAIDDKSAVAVSVSSQGSTTSVDSDSTPKARALSRTMSMEERQSFLDQLNRLVTVQQYQLSNADAKDIRPPKGLYTRLIPADEAHPEENILIVGQDETEVEKVYQTRKNEREANLRKDRRGSGGFRAVAGGALVGAVATFTGLAYA
ncbi:hypothetical protein VNI00_005794 [Paramarasmius palmivorus]|uniref:Uncharacterized protein n=1 Tax=Paramarasmius palmivorus TaxID=297713 RepID=A0AAW0DEZ1_9AGAR